MKLFLMRHADAFPMVGEEDDPERRLTDRGKDQIKKTLSWLNEKGITFDYILSSPYLRAFETAELVARNLGIEDKLIREPLLVPGLEFTNFMELLDEYQDCNNILVVGHEPDLGIIAGELLYLDEPRPLKKAEIVEIDIVE